MVQPKRKIAVFASGGGTNAEKIFQRFQHHPAIEVSLLLTNNPHAGVINRARRYQIPVEIFDRPTFTKTNEIVTLLQENGIDLIVLAGFLWLVPRNLIEAFPDKIINIHPALLPAYGGKGMYGMYVHQAVVVAKEKESGITIHYVNEQYDEGNHIFQISCAVDAADTPEQVAAKVQVLEHQYYPEIVENLILKMKN